MARRQEAALHRWSVSRVTRVAKSPKGSARIPGSRPNGSKPGATNIYKPPALSVDGNRVFFETTDPLSFEDTNTGVVDVYEWEAEGVGTCGRTGGCVQLISGGRSLEPSYFLEADEDGSEAFFPTAASLYPTSAAVGSPSGEPLGTSHTISNAATA
jgi:hypothetical protein